MLLTIDVGNTHTVLGCYDGEELRRMWRVKTDPSQTADELLVSLHGLLGVEGICPEDVHGLSLGSVVPGLNRSWRKVGEELCGWRVLSVDEKTVEGLLDASAYASTPGADRLADAVAARMLYGDPVVVVDMGTATNIEVVGDGGRFLGGVIAPGIRTGAESLAGRTALLPEVELLDPGHAIGVDTVSAMQIGVVYGQVDSIDGLIRRIWEELGCQCPVVATGGFGGLLGELSRTLTCVNPELTLQGLRLIYEARS